MVKLNPRQLGELVLLIFGTKSVVGGGCGKDSSRTDCTSKELAVLAGCDGGQDCRVEREHETGKEAIRKQTAPAPGDWVNIYS